MISAERLEELRELIEPDVNALPDRRTFPDTKDGDSDSSGGVLLEPDLLDMSACEQDIPKEKISLSETPSTATPTLTAGHSDRSFVRAEKASSSFDLNIDSLSVSSSPSGPQAIEPPATDLQRGDLSPAHRQFTPIQALARYPYTYCSKSCMQDIASAFFDQGKFWKRVWDL